MDNQTVERHSDLAPAPLQSNVYLVSWESGPASSSTRVKKLHSRDSQCKLSRRVNLAQDTHKIRSIFSNSHNDLWFNCPILQPILDFPLHISNRPSSDVYFSGVWHGDVARRIDGLRRHID